MSRKRIYIDVDEDQYALLERSFPHGTRQSFFRPLIDDICAILKDEEKGRRLISAVISRKLRFWDIHKQGEQDA